MGLTSKAKWDQMGVSEPIYGYVFDYMLVDNGGVVPIQIHPKVEAKLLSLSVKILKVLELQVLKY